MRLRQGLFRPIEQGECNLIHQLLPHKARHPEPVTGPVYSVAVATPDALWSPPYWQPVQSARLGDTTSSPRYTTRLRMYRTPALPGVGSPWNRMF